MALNLTQRCVHEDGAVEFARGACNAHSSHLVKHAQWVTPGQQFSHISLFQSSSDQQHHIVDHVAIAVETEAKVS